MHASSTPAPLKRIFLCGVALLTASSLAAAAALPGIGDSSGGSDDGSKSLGQTAKGLEEFAKADESLRAVMKDQVKLQRVVDRIGEMALYIKANNAASSGLQKLQPTATLAALEKAAAAAKGAGDAPWFAGEQAPIPSLSMAQKSVADVQLQIQKAQSDRANLEKRRNDASAQGETLGRQAESLTGKQGLDVYTQAAAQRKSAADLTAQIEDADAKLMLLQQDLGLAQAQQKQLEEAANRIAGLSKQTAAGWESLQKQMQAYTELSRAMLQRGSAPSTQPAGGVSPATIGEAIDQLNALTKAIDGNQAAAEGHFGSALGAFAQAATSGRTAMKQYSDNLRERQMSAQAPAWSAGMEVFNPAVPSLNKAQVELRQAQMYARAYYSAAARSAVLKDLKAALDDAKLSLPSVTSESVTVPEGEKNAAVAKARPLFDSADKDLDGAISAGGAVKDAARLTKVIEQYSYAMLLRSIQDTDSAAKKLEEARMLAGQLGGPNFTLPPLPAEITPAPEKTPPASTTAPAAGGAAAPAAPATAPATQPGATQPGA